MKELHAQQTLHTAQVSHSIQIILEIRINLENIYYGRNVTSIRLVKQRAEQLGVSTAAKQFGISPNALSCYV